MALAAFILLCNYYIYLFETKLLNVKVKKQTKGVISGQNSNIQDSFFPSVFVVYLLLIHKLELLTYFQIFIFFFIIPSFS